MSAATITGPLVTLALPQDRNARLVVQILLVLAGTVLLTLAAKITVPFWPVPMTLQTLAVFLIAAAYGRNLAVATLLAYLVEGAVGLPVFATGAGLPIWPARQAVILSVLSSPPQSSAMQSTAGWIAISSRCSAP